MFEVIVMSLQNNLELIYDWFYAHKVFLKYENCYHLQSKIAQFLFNKIDKIIEPTYSLQMLIDT